MKNALFCLLIMLLSLFACDESESDFIRALKIPDMDMSMVEDGRYRGSVLYHKTVYETEIEVRQHRIESIRVIQSEGDKYDEMALPVLQKVIDEQSLQVDVVTGATKSCKLYLLTIHNAVSHKKIDIQQLMSE